MSRTDKLIHVVAFALLTWLLRALYSQIPQRSLNALLFMSIGVTIAYGVLDEGHQWLGGQRHADVADLAADSLGDALGTWTWRQIGARWPWMH